LAILTGPAFSADFPSAKSDYVNPAPVFSWTGFYAGADLGGSQANADWSDAFYGALGNHATGFAGGGHIGYNYQISQFVLGVEGDFLGTAASHSAYSSALDLTTKASIDYLGSINARVGTAVDRTLFYAIGGFAFTEGSSAFTAGASGFSGPPGASVSFSRSWSGFDVGLGFEWAFLQNWSARVEYRYYDFSHWSYPVESWAGNGRMTLNDSTFTVGLSYLFSTPLSAPVVARY
jgi:outer membrane immunogenic protein